MSVSQRRLEKGLTQSPMPWHREGMQANAAWSTSAQERMGLMIVRALSCLRAGQFALWLWVPAVRGLGKFSLIVFIGYALVAAWSVVLFKVGIRRRVIAPRWLAADVVIAIVTATVVSRAFPLGEAASTNNWVIAPICGTAVTVAVYANRSAAVAGVGLIAAAWLAGTWRDTASASAQTVYANAGVIIIFALVTRLNGWILFQSARETDAATLSALEARQREAAAEARDQERKRQYGELHDTVLHTLEHISRGVWDVQSLKARENCERDSEYLRGLITGSVDNIPTDLGSSLAVMSRDRSTLGSLRINQKFDGLPRQLPAHVAEALTGAAREALNNAAKYAHVDQVWLTAIGDGNGGVTITVVDRGDGFDPAAPRPGCLGITRSIRHRVIEVGGTVNIDSAPGEGTIVELSWKP
jgi:signal transduction histidine kinase